MSKDWLCECGHPLKAHPSVPWNGRRGCEEPLCIRYLTSNTDPIMRFEIPACNDYTPEDNLRYLERKDRQAELI